MINDIHTIGAERLRGVVCAGLYSSASTWAFNIVVEMLRSCTVRQVVPVYADSLDAPALAALDQPDMLVLKTHVPNESLKGFIENEELRIILTVRDPRDAVASLMARFGRNFQTALAEVEWSANSLLSFYERSGKLVLKYEEKFTVRRGISVIGQHLGMPESPAIERKLARRFSAPAVARHVSHLMASGVLHGEDPAMVWEAGTQWHPHHIGDGRVGKHRDILGEREVDEILFRTQPFCAAFGYPLPVAA